MYVRLLNITQIALQLNNNFNAKVILCAKILSLCSWIMAVWFIYWGNNWIKWGANEITVWLDL